MCGGNTTFPEGVSTPVYWVTIEKSSAPIPSFRVSASQYKLNLNFNLKLQLELKLQPQKFEFELRLKLE